MAAQRMTQTQLVRSLAEHCEVPNKTARSFVEALASMAIAEVKKNGVFVIPGLGRLVRQERKARMELSSVEAAYWAMDAVRNSHADSARFSLAVKGGTPQ